MKNMIAAITLICCFAFPALGQTPVGSWGSPPYHHVLLENNVLYMISEDGFLDTFRVDDPANPVHTGRLQLEGTPIELNIQGDIGYLTANWAGLYVLDMSTPETPAIIRLLDLEAGVEDIAVNGSIMVLGTKTQGLLFLDLTDPELPELIRAYGTDDTVLEEPELLEQVTDVAFYDGNLFIVDHGNGIQVLDITDLDNITQDSPIGFSTYVSELLIVDGIMYVSLGRNGLSIVDVTDPEAMVQLATFTSITIDPDEEVEGDEETYSVEDLKQVKVNGDLLYLADGLNGITILDVADYENLNVINQYNSSGYRTTGIAFADNTAFLAETKGGLGIYDLTDPEAIVDVAAVRESGYMADLYVDGNRVYSADFYNGIRILDAADRAEPVQLADISTAASPVAVAAAGDLVYVADWAAGVTVIDVGDPAAPAILNSVTVGGIGIELFLHNNLLIAAGEYGGMSILSLDTPELPELLSSWSASGFVYNLRAQGDILALAGGGGGLELVSIADPANPVMLGQFDTAGIAADVELNANTACVADFYAGVYVLDITDPANPVQLALIPEATGAESLVLLDNHLYVARGSLGLDVYDLADPANPVFHSSIITDGTVREVQVSDGYLYLADGITGRVLIYQGPDMAPVAVPHIAAGNGWASGLTFTNDGETDAQAVLTIFRNAVPVESRPVSVPAGQHITVTLPEEGCAEITRLPETVQVEQTISMVKDGRSVSFPLGAALTDFATLELNTATEWTGVALMNGGDEAAVLTVTALAMDGTAIATTTVHLGPDYRNAWLIPDLFPQLEPGVVTAVTISGDTPFAALAIWETADGDLKAAVPTSVQ